MSSVHLVDATYELFRAYFGAPPKRAPSGREVGAARGVAATLIMMLRSEGATHVGCATDHVIRSFRNQLWPGYKTEEGIPIELSSQFQLIEDLMRALGLVVWPMVEFEADDAIAAAAVKFAPSVDHVYVCTVDKDLAQCVRGKHVVFVDRRRKIVLDEDGVIEKFGVTPIQIPDWLALVGDTADGYPGIPGFGKKTAATLLGAFRTLEEVTFDLARWPRSIRGASTLAATLEEHREEALLFKRLATLRCDVPIPESLEEMEWRGARPAFRALSSELGFPELCERVPTWQSEAG